MNGCANNTTVRYLKSLGKILRISLSLKWIDSDPMFGYKLKSKNVERSFLTEDELTKISEKQFLTERLSQVRDVFIFCCFTGLAYSDIEKLSLSNIKKGVDGKQWVYTNRTKTEPGLLFPYYHQQSQYWKNTMTIHIASPKTGHCQFQASKVK
ncbi:hypothetical protein ACFOG5_24645 [Pedobacter fastidiosus]|uniref:hypothetical protein n=1 Tax=Pedobacter fastidiosus TaxID=2765361 RepID=UPI003606EC49